TLIRVLRLPETLFVHRDLIRAELAPGLDALEVRPLALLDEKIRDETRHTARLFGSGTGRGDADIGPFDRRDADSRTRRWTRRASVGLPSGRRERRQDPG